MGDLLSRVESENVEFVRYIDLKRAEWSDYRIQVTPWELETYLSVT